MLWIIAAAAVPSLLVIFGVALAAIIAVVQQRKKRTLHIGVSSMQLQHHIQYLGLFL